MTRVGYFHSDDADPYFYGTHSVPTWLCVLLEPGPPHCGPLILLPSISQALPSNLTKHMESVTAGCHTPHPEGPQF